MAWTPQLYSTIGSDIRVSMYPKQFAFCQSQKPIRGFTGGRGSGKSEVGAIDLLLKSKPGGLYLVVAPSYSMMEDTTFRSFVKVATSFGLWDDSRYWKQPRPRAILRNGAEYLFRSADDPETLRGGDKAGAWLDELQNSDEEAFNIVEPALRQWGRRGFVTGTFTPGSPDHWTSKKFINSDNPSLECFKASLRENIFIGEEIYQGLLESWAASPLRIRRELEGECIYLEGAEWDADYFNDNCWFDEWPVNASEGIRVMALDSSLGKDRKPGDYAAFVKCLWVNGYLYLDADMRQGQDSSLICQNGVEQYRQWCPHYFVVEQEMGQHLLISEMHKIADEMKMLMAITPMDTEKLAKEIRIRRLTPYVSRRWLRFKRNSPGAKLLREQMMSFPQGQHDDGPDSLEYCVRMLVKATTGQVLAPRGYGITPMGTVV